MAYRSETHSSLSTAYRRR